MLFDFHQEVIAREFNGSAYPQAAQTRPDGTLW
jgi:hypothetical protein